jgi:UDP-N-acetylglucosamine--N-acetylmuramyl-(pentapeptide) pyrophosphoryl-undecaprenol N-acetylglucosamine transferase
MVDKVVITAAGTGGHVFPGLAVAEYLKQKNCDIYWVGGSGMEADLIPSYGINFASIPFKGVRKKGLVTLLKMPFQLLKAVSLAKKYLQDLQPKIVIAMGGYISVPVGIAARLLNIPLIIHEQNAVAGMANKLLKRIAHKTLLGFDGALEGGIYTGNPMRKSFNETQITLDYLQQDAFDILHANQQPNFENQNLKILVLGGSLGASILNEVLPQALALVSQHKKIEVVHQSGKNHLDAAIKNYAKVNNVKAHLVSFIEDMKSAYEWADIVVCRSGAMTISELATVGVPSILVPYSNAVDDHQTKNAQILVKAKAAWLIPQQHLTAQRLADILKNISADKLRQMALKARLHSHHQATQKVADICLEVLHARS